MLLNELQKETRRDQEQDEQLRHQVDQIAGLAAEATAERVSRKQEIAALRDAFEQRLAASEYPVAAAAGAHALAAAFNR
jgi:hypothetical protein